MPGCGPSTETSGLGLQMPVWVGPPPRGAHLVNSLRPRFEEFARDTAPRPPARLIQAEAAVSGKLLIKNRWGRAGMLISDDQLEVLRRGGREAYELLVGL